MNISRSRDDVILLDNRATMPNPSESEVASATPGQDGLLALLRLRTRSVHSEVEQVTDLPSSVQTLCDYTELLQHYLIVHEHFESQLEQVGFESDWRCLGLNIGLHLRAGHLRDDLERLGVSSERPVGAAGPMLASFGESLGCLYVLEGSALGGRLIARDIAGRLPGVPTSFLSGTGRLHPAPWRAVQSALGQADRSRFDDAVHGALRTFDTFRTNLGVAARQGPGRR